MKCLESIRRFCVLSIILCGLFLFNVQASTKDDFIPIHNPSVDITKSTRAIKIDGSLDANGAAARHHGLKETISLHYRLQLALDRLGTKAILHANDIRRPQTSPSGYWRFAS